MERLSKSINKEIDAVKLYKDDLQEIINIFLKEGSFTDLKITTEEHEYTPEEISQINENANISEISGHKPFYLSIDFNKGFGKGVRVYSREDTIQAEGLVTKIEKALNKRRRKIYCLLTNGRIVFALYLICQILFVCLSVFNKIDYKVFIYLFAGWTIIYILYCILDYGKIIKKNVFYPQDNKESKGFFARKKDDLLVNLSSAIIGAVVGALITLLLTAD